MFIFTWKWSDLSHKKSGIHLVIWEQSSIKLRLLAGSIPDVVSSSLRQADQDYIIQFYPLPWYCAPWFFPFRISRHKYSASLPLHKWHIFHHSLLVQYLALRVPILSCHSILFSLPLFSISLFLSRLVHSCSFPNGMILHFIPCWFPHGFWDDHRTSSAKLSLKAMWASVYFFL